MKKESRTESLENSGQEPENGCKSGRNPLEEIIGNEEKNRLWRALLSLDSPGKEILILQYFSGLQQKEIAALLHLTPENVRVQGFRAKKKLRKLLENQRYTALTGSGKFPARIYGAIRFYGNDDWPQTDVLTETQKNAAGEGKILCRED